MPPRKTAKEHLSGLLDIRNPIVSQDGKQCELQKEVALKLIQTYGKANQAQKLVLYPKELWPIDWQEGHEDPSLTDLLSAFVKNVDGYRGWNNAFGMPDPGMKTLSSEARRY